MTYDCESRLSLAGKLTLRIAERCISSRERPEDVHEDCWQTPALGIECGCMEGMLMEWVEEAEDALSPDYPYAGQPITPWLPIVTAGATFTSPHVIASIGGAITSLSGSAQ